jgi:hypothetical protein
MIADHPAIFAQRTRGVPPLLFRSANPLHHRKASPLTSVSLSKAQTPQRWKKLGIRKNFLDEPNINQFR